MGGGSVAEWLLHRTLNPAVLGHHLLGLCLDCPKFKSSATLVNSQLVASCQLGFLNPVMLYYFELFDSKYLSGVPVN